MLGRLRLWWQSYKTRRKMDRVFSRGEDPYRYASSPYETARLAAMEAALRSAGGRFHRALEIGCAEGRFTARLAELADEVVAVDISAVPLERARRRLKGEGRVSFAQADIRAWTPPAGAPFDCVVLGDVLYYLDKPMVQDEFEKVFGAVAGWLAPGGTLLLAHGFGGEGELPSRRSYRERFCALGLSLVAESTAGDGQAETPVRCLLSLLSKSGNGAGLPSG